MLYLLIRSEVLDSWLDLQTMTFDPAVDPSIQNQQNLHYLSGLCNVAKTGNSSSFFCDNLAYSFFNVI